MFCTSCGKQIDDNAKFCIYCGAHLSANEAPAYEEPPAEEAVADTKISVDREAPAPTPVVTPQPTPPPAQPQEKKPVDYGKYSQVFWILYILSGVAILFLDVLMVQSKMFFSRGFGIFLGIIMLLVAVFSLFVTIFRFVTFVKSSAEEKNKNKTREILCFVIGIMLFLFAFSSIIVCFG